jgi:signal transduction histidine kinase
VAIAEGALRRLRALLGVPRAIVNLFDLAAGEAEWLAAIGRRRIRLGPGVRFPLALMGDVEGLRRGEVQVVDTAALPPGREVDDLLASGVRVYMVVPMIAGGELIGGLSFGGSPGEFSTEQITIAKGVANQLAIAIAQARLYERVKRQAEELERRVQERTLELSAANERLEGEIVERRRAEGEAGRANQAKSEFLSRMSHELRTPLNAILGFGQLLEIGAERPRDHESVEQILKGGRHLLNLINEVLDISRIEAGRLALSPEPVHVGEAVRGVLDLARPLAVDRRVTFSTDGEALFARYVLADSQRLQQVLLNMVSNAIKYNHDEGRVTVACQEAQAGRLRITVADTGVGIPPALQSRLFTPFDRLGVEAGGIEGTGLGLALSKRLVEAMGAPSV